MLNLDLPIDPTSPDWKKALQQLQGSILKYHGRDHTALLPLQLQPSRELRSKLGKFVMSRITSALAQADQTAKFKQRPKSKGPDNVVFCNFFLTVWGYTNLGHDVATLKAKFPQPQRDPAFNNWFLQGMEQTGGMLGDPPRLEWEKPYQGQMDAMLLLACDDRDALELAVRNAKDELKDFAIVLCEEWGKTLRQGDFTIEPFGFMDGISQPQFFAGDSELEKPSIVLEQDQLAEDDFAFGSYLVYRKLEQNVKQFWLDEQRLAAKLNLAGRDYDRAGAMMVGRFRNGTPLTTSAIAGPNPSHDNKFDYVSQQDELGTKCPLHAHIRKVRPRVFYRDRIVRRSVPYGPYDPAANERTDPPETGSGLLFLCYQRNIQAQFGGAQKDWANRVDFPDPDTGKDPVIGQGWSSTAQNWPVEWGGKATVPFQLGNYVTLKGGGYFFAPSVTYFEKLAGFTPDKRRPVASHKAAARAKIARRHD